MANAIYPGSFDPVHNGHVDIAARASKLFDRLLVAVYDPSPKELVFTTKERVDLCRKSMADLSNVEVVSFTGLAPDLAQSVGAQFIVRGLRAGVDFEMEFEMALMWRSLDQAIDIVCLMTALEYQFIHSSRIKEVGRLGGNIEGLVPQHVTAALAAKFKSAS